MVLIYAAVEMVLVKHLVLLVNFGDDLTGDSKTGGSGGFSRGLWWLGCTWQCP